MNKTVNVTKTGGFFAECGALDGEYNSNTLYMERSLEWDGVLIEANQKEFSQLLARKRKAYAVPVCLSQHPYPTEVIESSASNTLSPYFLSCSFSHII